MPRLAHVSVKVGSGHNLYTPEAFARIPLNERIKLMVERRVTFLDDHGREIPPRDAVPQLPRPGTGETTR